MIKKNREKKKEESADDARDHCACAAQLAYALLRKSVVTRGCV